MREARPGRCWYCGKQSLRVGDPLEHAIPAAIGGTLKTDRVCGECNQRARSEIDWPLQRDFLVATLATAYGDTQKAASGRGTTNLQWIPRLEGLTWRRRSAAQRRILRAGAGRHRVNGGDVEYRRKPALVEMSRALFQSPDWGSLRGLVFARCFVLSRR